VESIEQRIERNHFWKFHGGIHPPQQKFLTNDKPIRHITMAEQFIIPLQQHIGSSGQLLVQVGDKVLKGQPLSALNNPMAIPVHAPTSGTITAIKNAPSAHPSMLPQLCVYLAPDGEDKWRERERCHDFHLLTAHDIITKVSNAGIAGMGGAGFPTHIKLQTHQSIEYLIINGAECEPYITADDLLMRENASTIVDGIKILIHMLQPKCVLIGIEDNKPEAIRAMQQATSHLSNINVCVIPTIYPTGGEKQLIQVLTGTEIASGKLPIHHGIVMQNVATCYAIAEAVLNDTPLIQRVVTVTGRALDKPQNLWVPIGTPVRHLLSQCGYHPENNQQLIMGGPMMGFALASDMIPVVKTTNCIIAPSKEEIPLPQQELECIRCGQCAEVCPAQLLPQELQWYAKAHDHDKLKSLNLFDCIECGACAYVCPSNIPLVHYYRVAKADIRLENMQKQKAEKAKARFEARKQRLAQEKLKRELKHKQAAEARKARAAAQPDKADDAKNAVAAALARVRAKKQQSETAEQITQTTTPITNTPQQANSSAHETSTVDDKKAQVAAAIARAKAKKQAVTTTESIDAKANAVDSNNSSATDAIIASASDTVTTTEPSMLDKKAQVAAAIARAKAKKQAKQAHENTAKPNIDENNRTEAQMEPHSIIEKQADQTDDSSKNQTDTEQSEKQQRIAKAIEKAKRNATARQSTAQQASSEAVQTTDSDKAARIAAAIAKAKAKKQQAGNN
jgi:electron transport complex protein RnfC